MPSSTVRDSEAAAEFSPATIPSSTALDRSPLRLALAQPGDRRQGGLVFVTTPVFSRHLSARVLHAALEGDGAQKGSFYLSAGFTPTAQAVGGADGASCLGLFQQAVVPRWRWRMLENCGNAHEIAGRLMSVSGESGTEWVKYQGLTLETLLEALLAARGGPIDAGALIDDIGRAVQHQTDHPLAPLLPRWRRLYESLPTGFELSILPTLANGGTVFAFMDALAPSFDDQCAVLLNTVDPYVSGSTRELARIALRSVDVLVIKGFEHAERR